MFVTARKIRFAKLDLFRFTRQSLSTIIFPTCMCGYDLYWVSTYTELGNKVTSPLCPAPPDP